MEREGLTEQEAFARLRKASQISGRPLKVVAEALIATLDGRRVGRGALCRDASMRAGARGAGQVRRLPAWATRGRWVRVSRPQRGDGCECHGPGVRAVRCRA